MEKRSERFDFYQFIDSDQEDITESVDYLKSTFGGILDELLGDHEEEKKENEQKTN